MEAIIYQIVSPSGGSYIGSTTTSIERRLAQHRRLLNKGTHFNQFLQNVANKYPILEVNILRRFEYISKEEVVKEEQYYIDTLKPEYNICREAARPNSPAPRAVTAMNIITKEIREFASITEAEEILCVGNVRNHVRKPTRWKRCGNYVFKYKESTIELEDLVQATTKRVGKVKLYTLDTICK